MLRILLILDSKNGHSNITLGFSSFFEHHFDVQVTNIRPPLFLSRLGKVLQYIWPLGSTFFSIVLRKIIKTDQDYDLIIASGGNTLYSCASLSKTTGAKSIFVGRKRKLPIESVTMFAHFDEDLASLGYTIFDYFPSKQTKSRLENRLENDVAFLFGGDSKEIRWTKSDLLFICDFMKKLLTNTDSQLSISTSRRTSIESELLLSSFFEEKYIKDSCWVHQGDRRNIVHDYLSSARVLCVSGDSISMLHECLNHEKPVICFLPNTMNRNNRHLRHLDDLCNKGFIYVQQTTEPIDFEELGKYLTLKKDIERKQKKTDMLLYDLIQK